MFKLFGNGGKKTAKAVEYIIVGLGNPGSKYENTRHNMGFIAIERLAEKLGVAPMKRIKFKGVTATAEIAGKSVLLLKPSTYMNLSGQSVTEAMRFYKVPPENVILIFDDIMLDPGFIRVKRKGSDGGQNGVKNIIYLSGSDSFPRVKIGIGGKPHPDYDLSRWVTSKLTAKDMEVLSPAFDNAIDAVELIVSDNIDEAMARYNKYNKNGKGKQS